MLLKQSVLYELSAEAKVNPRLRTNFCLHKSIEDKVQRMFNAMEPGTVVPIYRHQGASETILLLRGKLKVSYYDDSKNAIEEHILEAGGETFGIHVPNETWHSVEVLKEGTVMFEVKEGPYHPLTDNDILK